MKKENDLPYIYSKNDVYFAQIGSEIESLAELELKDLGATGIKSVYRGAYFKATKEVLYKVNYCSRLVTRVLAPLIKFECHNPKYLHKTALSVNWDDFIKPDNTFAIFATVSHSKMKHSQYASLCLKDAIVDFFRNKTGKRPSIDKQDPDVWINLHIENNRATISIDTSGGSLHKRGYRIHSVKAPMQEIVAAVNIAYTQWDGEKKLYDPMCGSGTLLCEAHMKYCRIPSAYLRKKFGFMYLPDFEKTTWEMVKKQANAQIRQLPKGLIAGSDKTRRAVTAAQANLKQLPYGDSAIISQKEYSTIENLENRVVVCNPPYGIRLGETMDLKQFYENLGDYFKHNCKGSTAYVYFGDRQFIKNIGLKTSWKKIVKSGGLDGRLAKFEMY